MGYQQDRAFTDYIHKNVAIPRLYSQIGWQELQVQKDQLNGFDVQNGIDYMFIDQARDVYTVQERFRESKYSNYNDFTIRYRRDGNYHSDRVESEYYKIKAHFFTYGITNGSKNSPNTCTDFLKVAIINLDRIYELITDGKIVIKDNGEKTCYTLNTTFVCPVCYNRDGSSSFVPFDIPLLCELFGRDVILYQRGFIPEIVVMPDELHY